MVLLSGSSLAGKGYSILHDRVVVRSRAHWEGWTFPQGTLEIGEEGVRPKFVRKNVNACLDAGRFVHEVDKKQVDLFPGAWYDSKERKWFARGGIMRAGSNPEGAPAIMDGDPGTFWEPNLDDPVGNWWIEVDLGRLVCATKIVLKFAEQGDPFLQFKVFTSTGERAFELSSAMNYVLAGQTKGPNKTKKVFEFELSPTEASDENWVGRAVQYIRIVVTDSDGKRAELVTEQEYRSLPPGWRGAVDYIWKVAGEERVVTKEEYEDLPPEQRGGIRYYRRERPRLAELEVWTLGENVALDILKRGGSASDPNKMAVPAYAFDGLLTTWWKAAAYREVGYGAGWGLLTVDLGSKFWIDTICYVLKRGKYTEKGVLNGYCTRVSDGSRAPDGSLIWERVSPKSREIIWDDMWRLADRFEPRKVRYLEFRNLDILEKRPRTYTPLIYAGNVGELQLYGEGYVPEVVLTSPIIELGGPKNLTSIDWDAETPEGTKVEVRTRTGNELREVVHYFDRNGNEVSKFKYMNLPNFMKGDTLVEYLPGPDWSRWSRVYAEPGANFLSPSPRKYLMIQVKLISDDPYRAPSIRSITVRFGRPLVRRVVAEVNPDRGVRPGKEQEFQLLIRPSFSRNDVGFDEVMVVPSPSVEMDLLGGDELEVLKNRDDTLWVRLPEVIRSERTISLRFTSTLFSNGTTFQVMVGRRGSWQRVDSGDASELLPGKGTTVLLKVAKEIVGDLRVEPIFTPNLNVRISFSVFEIGFPRPVEVSIYDLRGRRVRSMSEVGAAGKYEFEWDGRDQDGNLVPPGVYLVRVRVEADRGAEVAQVRTVCVVY